MRQRIEVDFLDRLVLFGLEHVQNLTEVKLLAALDQHRLVVKVALGHLRQELCRRPEEVCLGQRSEQLLLTAHFGADAIETVNLLGAH